MNTIRAVVGSFIIYVCDNAGCITLRVTVPSLYLGTLFFGHSRETLPASLWGIMAFMVIFMFAASFVQEEDPGAEAFFGGGSTKKHG